jgi:uncharacterized protein DUF1963
MDLRMSDLLKRDSRRVHSEFDFAAARRVFASPSTDRPLEGEMVTSPHDLYSVEELRDQIGLRIGRVFPTDVFVFCKGQPERRDVTKVGGLPYWPVDRPWPVDEKGKHRRFLAQFNFMDSVDLFHDLPGEVLSLMVGEGDDWLWESDAIHFEWLPAGLPAVSVFDSNQIVTPAGPFYGAIHRTADYPDASDQAYESTASQAWNLPVINGTKIGGRPHFIQNDDELEGTSETVCPNPFNPSEMMVVPAKPARTGFLCQLGSIQAAPLVAYPWANRAEPLPAGFDGGTIHSDENCVVFSDMASIYIFRNESGEMSSCVEGY